ncbi:YidC/Oxa1 family membrane protein insertase [Candidatus Saccharibacteria bacterium]|nr:YidC/Oxa1 family membrane protein insertase [Candidatus Saccharibacteria bacterium]MBQ9016862.1 YidC/Oxa1 family membrane protein insertase [Candidatus Saccharibacteria bacterium]
MFELIDFLIVRPLVNILFVIYNFVGDFGLAIIIFTVIVKICMWPLVKRQLHQTRLMRKIQPELAEIKKRCNGNRQMESLQMMDLYKRNNIKPFRSVLSLLIQLPIFIALYTAISVVANPRPSSGDMCGYTNITHCAYAPVESLERIHELSEKQDTYLNARLDGDSEATYDFSPKLFGLVDLNATASGVFVGGATISELIVLLFAIGAALMQYWVSRQQLPTGKNKKDRKTFRQIMSEAKEGKEPDQEDMNAMMSRQMGFMMPLMMFLIMFNLPGSLSFYYLLTNVITVIQQRIVLNKSEDEMEASADKSILKELKKVQEAEVIENKKTGTKITRISAKDSKKKRR